MSSMKMASQERKALVVGLSGASSSGKTTLARLLRDIFPNTFVLHEDDFYKEEKECVLVFLTAKLRYACLLLLHLLFVFNLQEFPMVSIF